MGQLEEIVTLITGGGSGLGQAIVGRFVTEGAAVGVIYYDKDNLATVTDEYSDAVSTVHGDVCQLDHHGRCPRLSITSGRLDALVGTVAIAEYGSWVDKIPLGMLENGGFKG
jgi:NADP-dependent 3-hydroxy acid dehydrogenase YdfG